jgi:hypothetical protein
MTAYPLNQTLPSRTDLDNNNVLVSDYYLRVTVGNSFIASNLTISKAILRGLVFSLTTTQANATVILNNISISSTFTTYGNTNNGVQGAFQFIA